MMRQMRLPHFPPFSSLLMCTIVISRRMRSIVKSTRSMPFALPMRITLSASNPIKSGSIKTSRARNDVHLFCDETLEKGHGRIETRRYGITDTLSYLSSRDAWNGLQSIGMVETERQIGARIERKARYFISSRPADVQRFAQRVRSHWHIENKLHWRLDVIMGEDDAHIRVDHGPENMAVLRHIALNLLKHEPSKLSIQSKRLQAACDNKYLEKVIKMQTPY